MTPSPPRIRRAGMRDLDAVTALWIAIGERHDTLHPLFEMRVAPDAEAREVVRGLLRDPETLVLVSTAGERVLGLCIVRVAQGHRVMRERVRAEVTDLGVAADRRRQGIGRALVSHALQWAGERGIHHVVVRVAHSNPEAQAFWRSLGFGDLMDVLERRL